MKRFQKYLSLESLAVLVIVVAAAFLRLYRIGDYLTFLGDEGRDAIVVRGILQGHLTLLGPRASAGDFFLGPVYYYFMAPFLWLWHYDPVGPAIMIAIIGTITVWLVYFVGKHFFGTFPGLFAASLYALSPIVIAYSRSSWNPNPMPFFSLLILYLLYKALNGPSKRLFFLIGILFGITLQLHYLATFLGVVIIFYILFRRFMDDSWSGVKNSVDDFLRLFAGFLVGLSPFIAFEIRHGFTNTRTIFLFIFSNTFQAAYKTNHSFLAVIWDVFFRLFGRLMTRFPPPEQVSVQSNPNIAIWYSATMALAVISIIFFFRQLFRYFKSKDQIKINSYVLLAIWFVLGVLLFGFYKKQIYDYYFGFMFPVPFLLVGNFLGNIVTNKKYFKIGSIVGVGIFGYLVYFNFLGAPFFSSPNRQKDQVKLIANFVLSKTGNSPFNFALLTNGNSDHGYRYFFDLAGKSPTTIENSAVDPQRRSVTNQLLIVCEDPNCKPLGNSLWEVAGFGRAQIVNQWEVSVVKVYKLVHYIPPSIVKK